MNLTELTDKIAKFQSEINAEITEFVKTNAKYKIGDVVRSLYRDDNSFYAITQIGFQKNHGIVYYGKKIVKSTGKVSFMSMLSDIGIKENHLFKVSLKLKKQEISFIENLPELDIKIEI